VTGVAVGGLASTKYLVIHHAESASSVRTFNDNITLGGQPSPTSFSYSHSFDQTVTMDSSGNQSRAGAISSNRAQVTWGTSGGVWIKTSDSSTPGNCDGSDATGVGASIDRFGLDDPGIPGGPSGLSASGCGVTDPSFGTDGSLTEDNTFYDGFGKKWGVITTRVVSITQNSSTHDDTHIIVHWSGSILWTYQNWNNDNLVTDQTTTSTWSYSVEITLSGEYTWADVLADAKALALFILGARTGTPGCCQW
jgi:hypothetical protein